ncbi:MAG: sensor domain-containing protein [Patulibacter sp.]|nr:sensor domain-containing protein [Patulibacter sp.]
MSTAPTVPFSPVGPDAPDAASRPRFDPLRWLRQAVGDATYLLLGLATGTFCFSVAVTLASLSAGLFVLIIGIPVAMVSSEILRWCAELERMRARIVDPRPIRGVYRPGGPGFMATVRTFASDGRRWRDLGYHVIQFPVSVAGFCIATVAWATALALTFYPVYSWALPNDRGDDVSAWLERQIGTVPANVGLMLLGLALIPVAYLVCRGTTRVAVELTRLLLGDDQERLEARVSHLEQTRSGAVDASAAELRRIERDLHDGAQARMVAVAMDLGMADERMADDPEGARELVQGARDEARRALAEMRDLVRGIAPSVLADRGLEAALTSLIARAPVAVTLDVVLPQRPPASAETAAYFVVAEALANVGKHAAAEHCAIVVDVVDGELRVRVEDDGVGDARIGADGGLRGLQDRVAALDGRLTLTSPWNGPTILEARIPCAS